MFSLKALQATAVFLLACPVARPAAAGLRVLHAGLFAGSNQGNTGERELQYANADASKLLTVFQRYGNLTPELSFLVREANRSEIQRNLGELERRIERARRGQPSRVECLFYYSGHGGRDGIHVDGHVYRYRELYDDVRRLRCDLLVFVLDACNSGEFLHVKGVTLVDEEFRVRIYDDRQGEVFITSSADSESSQEKEDFKGSVFTHFFAGGLLGAADTNRDNLVTLSEAYNHASRSSIRETFGSARGLQVPTYRYEMQGSQDPVLTELVSKKAPLTVPDGLAGVLTFLDSERGVIWGDFDIRPETRRIFVPPGEYVVRLRDRGGRLLLGRCSVAATGPARFGAFTEIPEDSDPIKGWQAFRPYVLRLTSGMRLSPGRSLDRDRSYGGDLALLIDNFGAPSLYGGIGLAMYGSTSKRAIFDTAVMSSSLVPSIGAILGVAKRLTSYLALSSEIRAAVGYARVTTRLPAREEESRGALLDVSLRAQAAWSLYRDFALVLPTLYGAMLVYRQHGRGTQTWDVGAGAGVALAY